MLTKSIEASWSLFLIQHGFSSSFHKVFAKYNYVSLEVIQSCSVEQAFFFFNCCLFLFVLFVSLVCVTVEGQWYFSKKNVLKTN